MSAALDAIRLLLMAFGRKEPESGTELSRVFTKSAPQAATRFAANSRIAPLTANSLELVSSRRRETRDLGLAIELLRDQLVHATMCDQCVG